MLAVGNEELEKRPIVHAGDLIYCSKCNRRHRLKGGFKVEEDGTETPSELLLCYRCGKKLFLGALDNKLLSGLRLEGEA